MSVLYVCFGVLCGPHGSALLSHIEKSKRMFWKRSSLDALQIEALHTI